MTQEGSTSARRTVGPTEKASENPRKMERQRRDTAWATWMMALLPTLFVIATRIKQRPANTDQQEGPRPDVRLSAWIRATAQPDLSGTVLDSSFSLGEVNAI